MFDEKQIKTCGEIVFFLAIALETLFVLLDKSAYVIQHETWLYRLTFFMFSCKIALTKYSKREWLMILSLVILGLVSWYVTDREEVIRVVALTVACKGMDWKKISKLVFWETLIGCMIIAGLSLCGIGGSLSLTGHFRGGGIAETRYTLGMGHPNALHCMFLVTLVLGLAIYDNLMKWYSYIVVFVLNICIYILTDSRTSVLITIMAICFAAILHYGKHLRTRKILYILAILFLILCVCFSVFIAIVGVEIPILRQIDIRINGRFQWAKSDGGIQFWSLFSNRNNQNYFDMAYVKLFYWYGIIPAIIYLFFLILAIWNCRKKHAYEVFLVIMTFVSYSMIEAHAVSTFIGRNYVLFYLWNLCFPTDKQEYSLLDIGKASTRKWSKITK